MRFNWSVNHLDFNQPIMPKIVLKPEQKNKLLEMLVEGETYAVIAEQVGCSIQNVKYHAAQNKKRIKKLMEEHEDAVMQRGFANKVFRVRKLVRLAEKLEREIEGLPGKNGEKDGHGLWLHDVKFSPQGFEVQLEVYVGGLVNDYMKVMNDIAKEKGERINKAEVNLTGDILAHFVDLDPNTAV